MKRRDFILSGAVVGASLAPSTDRLPEIWEPAQEDNLDTDFTAEQAFKVLMDGNKRFVEGKSRHPRANEDWLKRLTKGQRPLATILACSDSRVPLELLFDQGFGDIFTVRVAGNVVTRYGIGSMEYSQHHLGTPLYIVLGHEGCGAVTAAMLPEEKRREEPKGVRELLDLVKIGNVDPSADDQAKLSAAVENNVRNSTKQILEGFQSQRG